MVQWYNYDGTMILHSSKNGLIEFMKYITFKCSGKSNQNKTKCNSTEPSDIMLIVVVDGMADFQYIDRSKAEDIRI